MTVMHYNYTHTEVAEVIDTPTLCEVKEGEEAAESEHKAEQEADRDGDVGHLLEG